MAAKMRISNIPKLAKTAVEIADAVGPLVAAYGPKAAEVVAEYGPKAVEAATSTAKVIGASAVKAGSAVADAAGKAVDGAKRAQGGKEQEKILRKAREDTIKSSAYSASAKEFKETCEAGRSAGITGGGFMSLPGCFVIMLLPNSLTKDYTKFEEVYVGSGLSLGNDVYEQLTGNGNADVYADVKYNKPVQVLLYPCDKDQIDEVKASLIINFQAYGSYNERDVANS